MGNHADMPAPRSIRWQGGSHGWRFLDDKVIVGRRHAPTEPPGDVFRLGPMLEAMRGRGWAEGKLPQPVSSCQSEFLQIGRRQFAAPIRPLDDEMMLVLHLRSPSNYGVARVSWPDVPAVPLGRRSRSAVSCALG
jgi:hypothetical protein